MIKDKKISIRLPLAEYMALELVAKTSYKGNISRVVSGLITGYLANLVNSNENK